MRALLLFSLLSLTAAAGHAGDREWDAKSGSRFADPARRQSMVYVPTQFFRTPEFTIYYGYKAMQFARERTPSRDALMQAPESTHILAEAAIPERVVSSWRRTRSNTVVETTTKQAAPSRGEVAETSIAPVTGPAPEIVADGTASEEERVSRAGRMEPLEKLDDQIRNEPENSGAYYFRGSLLHEKWEYQRAIEDYSQAIRLDPKNAAAYYKRALCYTALNRSDLALEDLAQANILAPRNNRPWSGQSGEWSRQHGY